MISLDCYSFIFLYILEKEIKSKFQRMRSQFLREAKREKMGPSGSGGETYTTKWVHYVRLRFLCDVVHVTNTVTNIN
jgi:hypothetical protein